MFKLNTVHTRSSTPGLTAAMRSTFHADAAKPRLQALKTTDVRKVNEADTASHSGRRSGRDLHELREYCKSPAEAHRLPELRIVDRVQFLRPARLGPRPVPHMLSLIRLR